MSELHLTLCDYPTKVVSMDKCFEILRDYLQPKSTESEEEVTLKILGLIPYGAPRSPEERGVCDTIIELSEQIPYNHSSQTKLVYLLQRLGRSKKLTVTPPTDRAEKYIHSYQYFGEALRDNWVDPEPESPDLFVNFQSFVATVFENRIFGNISSNWAIWILRDGLEESHKKEEDKGVRDAYISAAAQWILCYGHTLFRSILLATSSYSSDVKEDKSWRPGPMYSGKGVLSIDRWHFWRDRLNTYASSAKHPDLSKIGSCSKECKQLARNAVDMMDVLERSFSF